MTDGIPFVMTNAMKDALRRRGLADADIDEITPEEAHKIILTPDERTVRDFLEAFVALAISSLGGFSAWPTANEPQAPQRRRPRSGPLSPRQRRPGRVHDA